MCFRKAPPARRAGASVVAVKPEPNDAANNSPVPLSQQQQPPQPSSVSLGQPISHQDQQKWTSSTHPHGPPPVMNVAPNVPRPGPLPPHVINLHSFQLTWLATNSSATLFL